MSGTVILVDHKDIDCGEMGKYEAHEKGKLHRAFSILIVNSQHQVLLQKRALDKYHSGGLWSNTCCSHPRPGESTRGAAIRRLKEEMGLECPLEAQLSFIYKTDVGNRFTEHEYDHVFFGLTDKTPDPDPAEVADWKWMAAKNITQDLKQNKDVYTYWFCLIWEKAGEMLDPFIRAQKRQRIPDSG